MSKVEGEAATFSFLAAFLGSRRFQTGRQTASLVYWAMCCSDVG